jgi:hypothetical protein
MLVVSGDAAQQLVKVVSFETHRLGSDAADSLSRRKRGPAVAPFFKITYL